MMVNNSNSLQKYDFVANKLLSPFFFRKGKSSEVITLYLVMLHWLYHKFYSHQTLWIWKLQGNSNNLEIKVTIRRGALAAWRGGSRKKTQGEENPREQQVRKGDGGMKEERIN